MSAVTWGVSRARLDRSKEDAEQPAYSAGPIKHPSSNSLGGACEARTTHPMHSACHALYYHLMPLILLLNCHL
jgi:hypothetical protein